MPTNPTLTVYFYLSDGHCEPIPLGRCTLTKALEAVQKVFGISDGLYTKAELYKDKELIETVPNPASVQFVSILVQ